MSLTSGVALALTFDFDAEALWMGWGARGAKALSRGEFGARVGVPRILDFLTERGIASTWFIPGHDADTYPDLVARIADEGHEIGNHGYLHENFTDLSLGAIRDAILRGSQSLERIVGERPSGFRGPDGDFGREVLELLVEEGFTYDSSMKDGESELYWARGRDRLYDNAPNQLGDRLDLVEVPGSWIMQDLIYLERNYRNPQLMGGYTPSMVEELWTEQLDFVSQRICHGAVIVTMHPQCIGWGSRFRLLERFVAHAASAPNVRFTTCRELADGFRNAAADETVN